MSYQDWIVIGILLSTPVALLLIWLQNRKGKSTKVSRQDKLAKAARDVTKAYVADILGVLNGEKVRDDSSFLILYRQLNQFKCNQWRRHEGRLEEAIEGAVKMHSLSIDAEPEEIVEEMMILLLQLHASDGNLASVWTYRAMMMAPVGQQPDECLKVFLEHWLRVLDPID